MATDRKLIAEWFWTDRWMGSSAFLLPLEPRGLYREMLTQAWRRGARLPANHEAVQRAVGCTRAEWRRCWPQIEKYWRLDGDELVNDTQLEVFAETARLHEERVEAGRRGGLQSAASKRQAKLQAKLQAKPIANGNSPSPSPVLLERSPREHVTRVSDEIAERAGRFLDRYAALYQQHRHGARYVGKIHLDFQEAITLCQTWPDDRLDQLATAFLKTDHQFAANGSRTIAQFRAMASWCDSQL